ncbi:hypothetical protein CEXT_351721 [Caerostris extrusa]|uniref:Uncharacterized protein n=1 Tax=Caerostris extrusa TaxID=172846 RepID=A0AAV4V8N6_CAEEX|nr:hypothetical protein CEXT_351721 [Caerostris extrusa]
MLVVLKCFPSSVLCVSLRRICDCFYSVFIDLMEIKYARQQTAVSASQPTIPGCVLRYHFTHTKRPDVSSPFEPRLLFPIPLFPNKAEANRSMKKPPNLSWSNMSGPIQHGPADRSWSKMDCSARRNPHYPGILNFHQVDEKRIKTIRRGKHLKTSQHLRRKSFFLTAVKQTAVSASQPTTPGCITLPFHAHKDPLPLITPDSYFPAPFLNKAEANRSMEKKKPQKKEKRETVREEKDKKEVNKETWMRIISFDWNCLPRFFCCVILFIYKNCSSSSMENKSGDMHCLSFSLEKGIFVF